VRRLRLLRWQGGDAATRRDILISGRRVGLARGER
jgi:hypothetical protein